MKRAQEFLEMERTNELLKQQEIEMANAHKLNKKQVFGARFFFLLQLCLVFVQLLDQISRGQSKIDREIGKFQQTRDAERFRLIEQLQEGNSGPNHAVFSVRMV